MQSETLHDFYLGITRAIFPEFALSKWHHKIYDEEYYYYDLQRVEVVPEVKLPGDKFDFAFNIICLFGMRDRATHGKHWYKSARGATFEISLPRLTVVQRDKILLPPEKVAKGMKEVFRANVLLLNSPRDGDTDRFKSLLKCEGIYLVLTKDIITANSNKAVISSGCND